MTRQKHLRATWQEFLVHYTTEGCPKPECIVCRRSKEVLAKMKTAVDDVCINWGPKP